MLAFASAAVLAALALNPADAAGAAGADAGLDWNALKAGPEQRNYWINQVAPADDLRQYMKDPTRKFRFTMGAGAAEEYDAFGASFARLGYGRLFRNDTAGALAFLNDRTGRAFASWGALQGCAASFECRTAFATDPAFLGRSGTVQRVVAVVNARATIRCHAHPQSIGCHEKTRHLNRGKFFAVEAVADGERTPREALIMCHDWPAEAYAALPDLTPCHGMPHGLVVTITDAAMPVFDLAEKTCQPAGECCDEAGDLTLPCCPGLACKKDPFFNYCA